MSYTALEKLKEIEREIAQRIRYYPGMIERGTLTFEKAKTQLDIMRAISVDYFKIVEARLNPHEPELPLDDDRTTILSGG